MAKAYGDEIDFSVSGLGSMIDKVKELKAEIEIIKGKYDDYIVEELAPNWRTTGGEVMINKLKNFSSNDLQGFIKYLGNKVEDLEESHGYTGKMKEL